ncbi:MAG: IS200/IS605 family transposase [Imperialibacter sp.]
MPNTYNKVYIQTVFAVKFRQALIQKEWRADLMAVIGNLINETGCKNITVNGVDDHVHCFFNLKPSLAISDVMKSAKAKSSKWINDNKLTPQRFEWQGGFGAFSYNQSQVNNVFNYIKNQEAYHNKQSFIDEYIEFLERFEIDYDREYLFKEPI